MDRLTIFLDEILKREMAKYEFNWSEVCIEAIKTKIKILQNDNDLFDSDIEVNVLSQKEIQIPELDRELYETFRRVWKDYFSFYSPQPKPPTSTQIKDLWKLWYDPYFDQGSWYDNYSEKIYDHTFEEDLSQDALEQWELFKSFAEEWGADLSYTAFGEFITKFVYDGELLNITKLDPFKLSSITMNEKDDLPNSSGIYFVIDKNNIYYIGMSKNIRKRWYDHHRQSDFDKYSDLNISYLDSLPVKFLKSIETQFIKHFKPLLNIKENPLLQAKSF